MTLTVKHGFNVAIADDPTAAAAGEVLPSHWNANHGVTGTVGPEIGARTILTANTNYYVRTDGSDSNTGTANTAGGAWATLQHAMNVLSATLDIAGFKIIVNVGAGSFVGFGAKTTIGGGIINFFGAGSASTTVHSGPNDGTYNFGEWISAYVVCDSIVQINGMTFGSDTVANTFCGFTLNGFAAGFNFGDIFNIVPTSADLLFHIDANAGQQLINIQRPGSSQFMFGSTTINFTSSPSTIGSIIECFDQGIVTMATGAQGTPLTITGNPNFPGSNVLVAGENGGIFDASTIGGSFTGACTGNLGRADAGIVAYNNTLPGSLKLGVVGFGGTLY